MQTDHTGIEEVAAAIKLSKKTKFRIIRAGINKNSYPVFECKESTTNEKAVQRFLEWAEITDNCIAYEIELFSSKEEDEANGLEYNKKLGNIRLTFKLNKEEKYIPYNQQQQNNNNTSDIAVENALLKQKAYYENRELMQKFADMEARFNEYMDQEDDDQDQAELSGLNNPNIVNLLGILSKSLSGNKPSVVNGLRSEQITNINNAIKILSKYDDQIDSDLLKLANLAENKTGTFEMLLKTLRSM
jgi:hypothetical protein